MSDVYYTYAVKCEYCNLEIKITTPFENFESYLSDGRRTKIKCLKSRQEYGHCFRKVGYFNDKKEDD